MTVDPMFAIVSGPHAGGPIYRVEAVFSGPDAKSRAAALQAFARENNKPKNTPSGPVRSPYAHAAPLTVPTAIVAIPPAGVWSSIRGMVYRLIGPIQVYRSSPYHAALEAIAKVPIGPPLPLEGDPREVSDAA